MNYFKMLQAELRGLLLEMKRIPDYENLSFFSRWKTVLRRRLRLLYVDGAGKADKWKSKTN